MLLTAFHHTTILLSFFFTDTPTTDIYTLSLHDALPIFLPHSESWTVRRPASKTPPLFTQKGNNHGTGDRKSTRLNSSHVAISYAVFCLKKKNNLQPTQLRQRRHCLNMRNKPYSLSIHQV